MQKILMCHAENLRLLLITKPINHVIFETLKIANIIKH